MVSCLMKCEWREIMNQVVTKQVTMLGAENAALRRIPTWQMSAPLAISRPQQAPALRDVAHALAEKMEREGEKAEEAVVAAGLKVCPLEARCHRTLKDVVTGYELHVPAVDTVMIAKLDAVATGVTTKAKREATA